MAEDIERIEVIRGSQSGIYGSKAIGGVINIITKGGRGPLTLTARAEAGGYGTRDVAARASGGTDKFWLSVGANYREQNDFNWDPWGSEDDPWRHSTFQVKGGLALMQGMTLDFFARRSDKFAHTDADFFAPRPQTPFSSAIDAPDTADQQIFLGGVNLRWDMLGGALTHVVKANRNDTDLESFTFGSVSTNDSVVDTLSYLATYRFGASQFLQSKHSISGFIEKKEEEFTPKAFFTDGLTRKRGHVATVAEYRAGFYDRLFVGGSIRHDDNDKFADFTTWNINASLNIPEIGLRPHASTGTGVALPGMFEQFGSILGTFVGNPDLVPEESESWDAGVELTFLGGRALLDVTYFNANLTNEIDGFGNTLFNQFGESKRSGVEVAGRLIVLPGLSLGGSYTFLDATEPNGQQEDRRPKHTGRTDLNYSFDAGRGNLNVAAIYNGVNPYVDLISGELVSLDPYWLVNVAASYRLTSEWEVFGRVENALDERYEELLGYNTPGLTAYAGMKLTFTATEGAAGR
jgi:vitamin B12 transporter